jgi:hypothetical protein
MPDIIHYPTADSFLRGTPVGSQDTNFGSNDAIAFGVVYSGGAKSTLDRAIGRFDVSAIAAADVLTARLERNITDVVVGGGAAKIYRSLQPSTWTENGVTWNKYDGVNAWPGPPAQPAAPSPPDPVAFIDATATGTHQIFGLAGLVIDAITNRAGTLSIVIELDDEIPPFHRYTQWRHGTGATFGWRLVVETASTAAPGRRDRRTTVSGRRPRRPAQGRSPSSPPPASKGRRP